MPNGLIDWNVAVEKELNYDERSAQIFVELFSVSMFLWITYMNAEF